MIYRILFVLFCGNCSPASTRACSKWNPRNPANSRLQTFSHSKSAGFSGGAGPTTLSKTSWHSRCHNGAHTRSIAVIGRKRSAQESWDDACASRHFRKGPFNLKRRPELDLIFQS